MLPNKLHPILESRLRLRKPLPSRDHRIVRNHNNRFTLCWIVDLPFRNSTQTVPRECYRPTDYRGAVRFARKWGLPIPHPSL